MHVRLLGPVEVVRNGVPRPVPGARRQALLAVLALHRGQIVDGRRLTDLVWSDTGRPAANTVQTNISYLRRSLGVPIVARAAGYLLDLVEDGTDVAVAEQLIRRALDTSDPDGRVGHLQTALGLWRGRPLAGIADLAWAQQQTRRLDQLRLDAVRALTDAQLELGRPQQVVSDLEQLTGEHPFDEELHGQLMLALYRTGRQAEALAVYERLRHSLADELGIDPGRALRELHTAVLRQDPTLSTLLLASPPSVAAVPATIVVPAPAQLPPALPAFVGRRAELARLDAVLPDPQDRALAIAAVSGPAGAGKTALAVHWAHRVAARFPGGQLFADLRGADPDGAALEPGQVIRRFLAALGIPTDRQPPDLDAQIGLFRSVLAGTRVLVVLDNARDVRQVRPLLPGTAGCLVVVTSRDRLTPLVATHGARPVTVDLLPAADARELLARRLGPDRLTAEPTAVDEIVTRCARLPIALAIVAARAALHPTFPLARLATELRAEAGRLDALNGGDAGTDVRAVFAGSLDGLSPAANRLFRLLGLHPGPDITAAAAASLAGVRVQEARASLAELAQAHLLDEHAPGRYAFHDLLWAFATEQVHAHEPDGARQAALHRMLDHYVHTAHAAARSLDPARATIELAAPRRGVTPERLHGPDDARDWFTAELPILLATVDRAATAGLDAPAWHLAWGLGPFLMRGGYWTEQVAVQRTALEAASRLDDADAQGLALCTLAGAYSRLGRLDDAEACYRQELRLFEAVGNLTGQARAHLGLARVTDYRGDTPSALGLARRALGLYRARGDRIGQAHALNWIGWFQSQLGEFHRAIGHGQRALALLRGSGQRATEADVWEGLGFAYRGLADHERAITCYQRAVDMVRELGDRYVEAFAMAGFGDAHNAAGDREAARIWWRQALDLFTDLGHTDADRTRAKLLAA